MPQIAQHMHCWICGKAMDWSATEKVCSPECQKTLDARNQKRRRYMWFLYAAMAASVTLLLLQFLGGAR